MATDAEIQAALQEQQARIAQNRYNLLHGQTQWAQLGNALGTTPNPQYALNTNFKFQLNNTQGYLRKFRLLFSGLDVNVATAAATGLTRGGLLAFLGSLTVKLGANIYNFENAPLLDILGHTFSRDGHSMWFNGWNLDSGVSYGYAPALAGSVNGSTYDAGTYQVAVGDNLYNFWIDIPMTLLAMVGESDGIAPTLSNSSMSVEFHTPSALSATYGSADHLAFPINPSATSVVTLGNTGKGYVRCYAQLDLLRTVFSSEALPPYEVGSGFRFEQNTVDLLKGNNYYTFQGDAGNEVLLKTVMIVNDPGSLAGEFSNLTANAIKMDLKYDSQNPIVEHNEDTDPGSDGYFGTQEPYLKNFFIDQRQKFGDQPNGIAIFDWSAGTNANYPNSYGYLNIKKFNKAGIQLNYNATPNAGATITFANIYLDPKLYTAQG